MKKNQQGIAMIVEIIAGVVVLAIIALAGLLVLQAQTKPKATETVTETKNTETKTGKWVEGDFAMAGTFADASVVQIAEDTWRMYYAIQPEVQGHNFEIFSAVSKDGKKWTQEPGVRKTMATFPEVVKLKDDTWRMYFQQAGNIKSAVSKDGLTFVDETGNRIDRANDLNLDFDNVAAPAVYRQSENNFLMVYRGTINTRYAASTPNPNTQILFWATSTDGGLTWVKKGYAADSRNATLRGNLDGPNLVKWDDGKVHLFATSYKGVFEYVFEKDKFNGGTMAYTTIPDDPPPQPTPPGETPKPQQPRLDQAPPGDPAIIKIKGTWYMYYGGSKDKNGIRYATYK